VKAFETKTHTRENEVTQAEMERVCCNFTKLFCSLFFIPPSRCAESRARS